MAKWRKCEFCRERKEDVYERLCPYMLEIHSKEVVFVMCDDCHDERYQDV